MESERSATQHGLLRNPRSTSPASMPGFHAQTDDSDVFAEARRIGEETKRKRMRVISGRLTALRKSGAIHYLKKSDAPDGKVGWHLAVTTR